MKIMHSIFKTFLLSLLVFAQVHFAYAQVASILPPAKTTFVDQNGKPLTSGTVDFYIPSTTTRKTTWQDAAETIPNTNPVVLDAAGRALILGSGVYRQIVKDRLGNLIWDQVTSSTGSGSTPTVSTGDGDLVGTIKPWAGMTAPNQYMFAYGEELSRTTYAALLTAITSTQAVFCNSGSAILNGLSDTTNFPIGAKVEISCVVAGSSTIISKTSSSITLAANSNVTTNATAIIYPWGNGNGTTTFNAPDFRGFVIAGNNNMGGTASAILTTTFFGSANPNSIGAAGGNQSSTLLTTNLPPYTPSGTIANGAITISGDGATKPGGGGTGYGGSGEIASVANITASQATSTFTGTAQGGTSTAFSLIQPTKTSNYIIKVTPDTNSATASGVTSLGGMIGDIACGTGLLCTGNTVSIVTGATCTDIGAFLVGNGASTQCSDTVNSTAILNGPFTITPTAASTQLALSTQQTGSGVPTAASNGVGYGYNHIYVPSSGVDVSSFTNGSQISSGLIVDVYPNNGSKGNVQGLYGIVSVPPSATVNTTINWGYAGVQGVASTSTNLGGISGTPRGSVFGGGMQAKADASFIFGAVGMETDTIATSNATGLARRLGLSAVDANGSTSSVVGLLYDAAFAVGASTGSPGWTTPFLISANNGGTPVNSGSTLFATSGSATVKSFFDVSSYLCSGGFIFNSTNFIVDCSGNVATAGGLKGASVGFNGSTSGTTTIQATAIASGTLTLPAATDQLVARATTDTLTNKTISGSSNTLSNISNGSLTNSTISGVVLGANLNALTFGTHLTSGGSSYNGSAGVTITSDATAANTASTIMARDGSGQVTATTFTGALTGHSSLDLALTGGTMSGNIAMGGNNISGGGAFTATSMTSKLFPTAGTFTAGTAQVYTSIGAGGTGLTFTAGSNPSGATEVGFYSAGGVLIFGTAPASANITFGTVNIQQTETFAGQFVTATGTPTIGSGACGTGTNGVITSGDNQSMLITIGAVATTSCAVSFSSNLGVAPKACLFSPANAAAAAGTVLARIGSISISGFTLSGSILASTSFYIHCY